MCVSVTDNDTCVDHECVNGATCKQILGGYTCGPCPDGFAGLYCQRGNVVWQCLSVCLFDTRADRALVDLQGSTASEVMLYGSICLSVCLSALMDLPGSTASEVMLYGSVCLCICLSVDLVLKHVRVLSLHDAAAFYPGSFFPRPLKFLSKNFLASSGDRPIECLKPPRSPS